MKTIENVLKYSRNKHIEIYFGCTTLTPPPVVQMSGWKGGLEPGKKDFEFSICFPGLGVQGWC